MRKIVYFSSISVVLLAFMTNSVYADNISSDYYEMGDFLFVKGVNVTQDMFIDIQGMGLDKSYVTDMRGEFEIGFPLNERNGYHSGLYTVTITNGDKITEQQFGLNQHIPELTLRLDKNMVPLDENLRVFGTLVNDNPRLLSYKDSVEIQIIDNKGEIMNNGWFDPHPTAHTAHKHYGVGDHVYRVSVNNHQSFVETIEERYNFSGVPLENNGYRLEIALNPLVFKAGETYTVKAIHDNLTETTQFTMVNYEGVMAVNNNSCEYDQHIFDHITNQITKFQEYDIIKKVDEWKRTLDNFNFRIVECDPRNN